MITSDFIYLFLHFFQDEENSTSSVRVKELEEERGRLTRTNAAQGTQIDKFKKIADDNKTKAESLDTQLSAAKKVRRKDFLRLPFRSHLINILKKNSIHLL